MMRRFNRATVFLVAALSIVPITTIALCVESSTALAQGTPLIERPIPFDSAGRILTLTPMMAARLSLAAPAWPVGSDWKEARLFASEALLHVLAATRSDGSVARYTLDTDALARLRRAVNDGVLKRGGDVTGEGAAGDAATGFVRSEPAGNSFVRNQVFLGLAAYGPATSAILSDNGTAASAGGYLLAAGSSFFVAAQLIRTHPVTRAQNILATHAGIRGAIAGAALGEIFNAHGGPSYGAPILGGALVGTVGGFHAARSMSDGEAAASGLIADLFALSTLGVSAAVGAFDSDSTEGSRKTAFGAAIGAGIVGYVIGPHYARRSSYNVSAGDVDVAFSAAQIGALGGLAITNSERNGHTAMALASVGLVGGFVVGDRLLVRKRDRTSADGTWASLGAVAGMLMGGGVGVISKASVQPTLGLIAAGGALGLFAADRMIAPARDAGPARGVLRSSAATLSRDPVRVQMGLGSVHVTF